MHLGALETRGRGWLTTQPKNTPTTRPKPSARHYNPTMFDIDEETTPEHIETRGRKPIGGAPRTRKAVILTEMEWRELEFADPSGKNNPQAGLRHLIAQRRNAATTQH